MATRMLSHDDIEIGGGTQARSEINYFVVNEYAEHYRNGVKFPPLVVYDDGAKKWLSRGFHRFHASKDAGVEKVECEVRKGSKRDAQWDAIGDNLDHGLRRTNADKRKAVDMALKDAEWSLMSDRAISEHVKVSHDFVSRVRIELASDANCENSPRTGKDGKRYKAKKKKRKPKAKKPKPAPVEVDEPDEEEQPDDETDPMDEALTNCRNNARAALKELEQCLVALDIDCDKEIAAIRIKLMKH